MVERLFFDGVDLDSGGGGVAETVKLAAPIDANEAESGLPFSNMAVARAEITVDFAFRVRSPPPGFVEGFRFLKDLQFGHGRFLVLSAIIRCQLARGSPGFWRQKPRLSKRGKL